MEDRLSDPEDTTVYKIALHVAAESRMFFLFPRVFAFAFDFDFAAAALCLASIRTRVGLF